MTNGRDPIAVLEAAYAWHDDEARWLGGVVDALAPFGLGGGILSYLVRLEGELRISSVATRAAPIDAAFFLGTFERLPRDIRRVMHTPSSAFVSVQTSTSETAELFGSSVADLETRIGYAPPPCWGFRPGDAGRFCWASVFLASPDARPPRQTTSLLANVAPHLASAARLRLAAQAAPSADDEATEAVLDVDGTIRDARGDARARRAREHLAELARQIDRARTRSGRAAAAEALATWTALLDGRWTVVESYERDGRRFLLARKNAPNLRDPGALSPKERAVVALAVQGQPHKLMAYSLGLSRDRVHAHLRSAMRKLRVSSRAELIRAYARVFAGVPYVE